MTNIMMVFKRVFKPLYLISMVLLILLLVPDMSFSNELNEWQEVASTSDGIQFINPKSISYDNKGFLSIETKYSELNPENQEIINTNIYEMQIDCENRLFKDISINGKLQKSSRWKDSKDDKLIKKTIINSCSY